MAKSVIDVRWLDAIQDFRRTHNGRNPNTYETVKLRESLKSN